MRLATFNAENLFARYNFKQGFDPVRDDGFTINNLAFRIHEEESKRLTAKAVRDVDADVICLQEVESLTVLDHFSSAFLATLKYKHRLLIDGHDPRQIDIAVLSRYPITFLRTHREGRSAGSQSFLFSRDCLEADVDVNGQTLSLYANHFKSMIGGRGQTRKRRVEQARRVAAIVEARWKPKDYEGNVVVLGDLNDYVDAETSLTALIEHPELVNVVNRLPAAERWTHYYSGGDEYRQLDYLLPSKALAERNPGAPGIMRKGLPFRAERYEGERFDGVGEDAPKASDHAPVFMDIELL